MAATRGPRRQASNLRSWPPAVSAAGQRTTCPRARSASSRPHGKGGILAWVSSLDIPSSLRSRRSRRRRRSSRLTLQPSRHSLVRPAPTQVALLRSRIGIRRRRRGTSTGCSERVPRGSCSRRRTTLQTETTQTKTTRPRLRLPRSSGLRCRGGRARRTLRITTAPAPPSNPRPRLEQYGECRSMRWPQSARKSSAPSLLQVRETEAPRGQRALRATRPRSRPRLLPAPSRVSARTATTAPRAQRRLRSGSCSGGTPSSLTPSPHRRPSSSIGTTPCFPPHASSTS
mmetsp:Transcript_64338/g.184918  ORF Transcript_64338/g.184918 Transcript_64338/m.184918 type:complete len:286 (-) Transcript_64338:918-1775(-)